QSLQRSSSRRTHCGVPSVLRFTDMSGSSMASMSISASLHCSGITLRYRYSSGSNSWILGRPFLFISSGISGIEIFPHLLHEGLEGLITRNDLLTDRLRLTVREQGEDRAVVEKFNIYFSIAISLRDCHPPDCGGCQPFRLVF